jgi:uncharacterized protein (DUF427 family)
MMKPRRINPRPGQESVWDYPRPPRLERVEHRIRVVFNGLEIANVQYAWRVLETSHPPTYYLPRDGIREDCLVPSARSSFCEWKGMAQYYSVSVAARVAEDVAWGYPEPTVGFEPLKGCVALYAGPMDGCFVGKERVEPQPGGFYGGWITSNIVGPFKGGPGTHGW